MALRSRAGSTLRKVIGPRRTQAVRRWERTARRKAALRLDPRAPRAVEATKRDYVPSDPFAQFPEPTRSRHQLLIGLHQHLRPRTYLEVGVHTGSSLALSRTRSIGIDPAYTITKEIACEVQLHRTTSDEFFSRPDPVAFFDGVPIDLAFIDGMHLSEFALRDFMNVEKLMSPAGVVLIDDMLPRNSLEAARERRTAAWAGDVFKVADILRTYRPDLTIIPVNTSPTGTVIVLGLDPTSRVLDDAYDAALLACQAPDPQVVPEETLRRTHAVDPVALLASPAWPKLAGMRKKTVNRAALNKVLATLTA
ncbi:class I SAM-dependent methyltransferase [Aeromicrobium sp. NPDC092404]|uniref:class I SAM-dependent methyltransferase n=1 Tax=Aeromicrobium sp. NPDC092404 TaxID=3154976 RepID=UPI0034221821